MSTNQAQTTLRGDAGLPLTDDPPLTYINQSSHTLRQRGVGNSPEQPITPTSGLTDNKLQPMTSDETVRAQGLRSDTHYTPNRRLFVCLSHGRGLRAFEDRGGLVFSPFDVWSDVVSSFVELRLGD